MASDLPLCTWCSQHLLGKIETDVTADERDCPSCELLANTSPNNEPGQSRPEHQNRRIRLETRVTWGILNKVEARAATSNRLHGTLYIDSSYKNTPLDLSEFADLKAAASWLEHCDRSHSARCGECDLPARYSTPMDILLVDVTQECLVMKTTASQYFALSYLWGNAITTTTTTNNLPQFCVPGSLGDDVALPSTVRDAILLTRNMGTRYLWVDCLSVVQDSNKKHQDIANMDVIFSQSALTIVASCSEDAGSGLAGIRQGTRRIRAMSTIRDGHSYKLHLPTSQHNILFGTAYTDRGWTFQELLVSKRLLFVTEHQLVFHCGTAIRSESLPEERRHHGSNFASGVIDLRLKASPARSNYEVLHSYTTLVNEYCTKNLSFQSDIEKAFAGLASILEEWCEGSPVVHGLMTSFLGYSLLWTFCDDPAASNYHSKPGPGTRRIGFPSWSWVGWVAVSANIGSHSTISLPLTSLMRQVEITTYTESTTSLSIDVLDKSSCEHDTQANEQQIRIRIRPTQPGTLRLSTLEFLGQRTSWENFTVASSDIPRTAFVFNPYGMSRPCGFLANTPNKEIAHALFDRTSNDRPGQGHQFSLVRLYKLNLEPWRMTDDVQLLLEKLEDDGFLDSSYDFRESLSHAELLFVLLVRRQGSFWERIGSGLMFEMDWPFTDLYAKVRAYEEKIVLV